MKQIKTELTADKRYINGKVDVKYYYPELSSALKKACQDLIHIGLLRVSDFKSENLCIEFTGDFKMDLMLKLKSEEVRHCLVDISFDDQCLSYDTKIIYGHRECKFIHVSSELISEAEEIIRMENDTLKADICISLLDYITDRNTNLSSDIKADKEKQKKSANSNHDIIADWRKVIENM